MIKTTFHLTTADGRTVSATLTAIDACEPGAVEWSGAVDLLIEHPSQASWYDVHALIDEACDHCPDARVAITYDPEPPACFWVVPCDNPQ